MDLRSKDPPVWLVGDRAPELCGRKLPSKREVLQVFFYFHLTEKKTVQESAKLVTEQLIKFWDRARIPYRQTYHVIKKIKDLFADWQKLHKNKNNKTKRSQTHIDKENKFSEDLDDLMDIAHQNALDMIIIEEDKLFLIAQREDGRRGYMSEVDTDLAEKEKR